MERVMKKLCLFLLFATLLLYPSHALFAQAFAKVGTIGAQFLEIGIGARPIGMGEAYTAVADDATAIFWNPAGLTKVEKNDIHVSHTDWILDMRQETVAYVQNLGMTGTVGIFFSLFSLGDFDGTNISGQGETFNPQYWLGGVSYARMLTDKFSFGANLKGVRQDFDVQDIVNDGIVAQNWAVDMGSLYHTGWKSLRIGMSIFNFGPELTPSGKYNDFNDDDITPDTTREFRSYDLPLTFRVGLAMEVIEKEDQGLTTAIEWTHPSDNLERIHLGAEYTLLDHLILRGGYKLVPAEIGNNNYDDEGFSTGVGFFVSVGEKLLNVDYGFSDFERLDDIHRVTLSFSF
jgi:hypothetical protein